VKYSAIVRDVTMSCVLALKRYTRTWVYKHIIKHLYGCETWSLILGQEHRLRVFENTVQRRIFEPKRDEVTGGWIELHNEARRDLYSSPGKIRGIKSRNMRWAEHVARMGRRGTRIGYR
jgi:hypothetical protein